MSLFAHLFSGRAMPLTARSGAVAESEHALGDCFPHVFSFDPLHAEVIATRRGPWSAGKVARVTRPRVTRVHEGPRATRFPPEDIQ